MTLPSIMITKNIETMKPKESAPAFDDELYVKDKIEIDRYQGILLPEHLIDKEISEIHSLIYTIRYANEDYIKQWIEMVESYFNTEVDKEYLLYLCNQIRKIGICWDKCELLRYYFENNHYELKTYFIYLYLNDNNCPSHAMLVYKKDNNLIWIEPSISKMLGGIHIYKTEEDFLIDMKQRFIQNGLNNNFFTEKDNLKKIYCYQFEKPMHGVRGSEYYNHCRKGKKIEI